MCFSDATNQIVDIQFDAVASSAVCKFLNLSMSVRRSINNTCSISYGPTSNGCTMKTQLSDHAGPASSNNGAVKLELTSLQKNITRSYCFVVTATINGSIVAVIEGTFTNNVASGIEFLLE